MSTIFFQISVFSLVFALSVSYNKNGYQSIELPVNSKHDLQIIRMKSELSDHVTYVEVPGGILPVHITFKTQSSPVHVKQIHRNTKGSRYRSDSMDEPHFLAHQVIKPVYQEIKEFIQPYRKIVQVIEPVKEERSTKVHKVHHQGALGHIHEDEEQADYGKVVMRANTGYGDQQSAKLGENYQDYYNENYQDSISNELIV